MSPSADATPLELRPAEGQLLREALERERYLLHTLLENMPDCIYFKDESGRFIRVNPALASFFGRAGEAEVLGTSDADFFPAADAARYRRDELEVMRTGRLLVGRIERCVDATGRGRWFSTNKAPIWNRAGSIVGIVGISREVTDVVRAEEALRASEGHFRAIFDDAGCAIAISDVDGTILRCNRAFGAFLGYANHELRGRKLAELAHPDGGPLAAAVAGAGQDGRLRLESCFRRCDGTLVWGRVNAARAHAVDDAPGFLINMVEDITDRKKAEAWRDGQNRVLEMLATGSALRDVLGTLVEMIEAQADGTIGSVLLHEAGRLWHGAAPHLPAEYNRAIDGMAVGPAAGSCGTAAHGPRQVIVEDTLTDPLWENFRELARTYGLRACWSQPVVSSTGEVLGTFAIYYRSPRRPTAAELELSLAAAHLAGVAIERDRHERRIRSVKEKLRSLASELALAQERERRRIAADIHDGFCQKLALVEIKLRGHVQAALRSAGARAALRDSIELVDQAIREARSLAFDLSPPILYDLGFEAAAGWLVEQHKGQSGIEIAFRDDGEPKPLDEGLRVILFRAIRELLFNVTRHSGASRASLSLRREDKHIRIDVEDPGVGFDPLEAESRPSECGGFGLFNIREQVSRRGGRVEVQSTPGQGTRVTLWAPLCLEEAAARPS